MKRSVSSPSGSGRSRPLISMTGRGVGRAASRLGRVEVEVSCVNRRQLEVAISLPRSLASYEPLLVPPIRRTILRGRVSGEVRVAWSAGTRFSAIRVEEPAAAAAIRTLRAAARRLRLPDDLTASALISLPEVLTLERSPAEIAAIWRLTRRALAEALRQLQAMRRWEGAALTRDLRLRLGQLLREIHAIRRRAPRVAETYRRRLLDRLRQALPEWNLDGDERLRKEVVLFADKADITEELVRIDSHLTQFARYLRTGGSAGRPLDFLAQELSREINTLSAKANDSVIVRHALAFKTILEQIREQVQNIE